MSQLIFLTSKEHLDIVKLEIETVCKSKTIELDKGIFFTETEINVEANRFGFVKEILILKKELPRDNYITSILNKDILNSYKINLLSNDSLLNTKDVADKLYSQLNSPRVNLENPDHEYTLLFLESKVLLLESLDKNTDKPENRKAHKKEHNHPTSLNPKLAKALINLLGKNAFHDPFCGTGGIVIEGALMGLHVSGSDIAPGLVQKAKENAKAYGLDINVFYKNALQITKQYSSIITDLPYGRNSTLTNKIDDLYAQFFKVAQKITDRMVVGMMEKTQTTNLLKHTSWEIKAEFIIYVHKSLSRKILLLEK